MAELEILTPGSFASLKVHLADGERFVSESGLMVRMSSNVDLDVTTKPKGKGGLLAGLKRLMGGDSFFMSTYTAAGAGEVVLAPIMPGDVHVMELSGKTPWLCAGASYMASGPEVALEPQFQGVKGLFSGESLFYLQVSGDGPAVVGAFGKIREIEVKGDLIVDTGHVVAFESTLDYTITKAGGSWFQSWLAGEGFVMNFSGRGKVLVQSHNPTEFGKALGPSLPYRGSAMNYEIIGGASYPALEVTLDPGDQIVSEAGAMAWMDAHVEVATAARGGVLAGLSRKMLTGESFFQNTYSVKDTPGLVAFVPGQPGTVLQHEMRGDLNLEKGAYLASTPGVQIQSKFEGLKGLFNEGLFVMRATGQGTLFFSGYGEVIEMEVDGDYTVDNGYAVAWEPSLSYKITKAKKIRSFLFSDQLLLRFSGRGKLWVQSRSAQSLANFFYPYRPVKSN